jgi:hypothetical protein
MGAAKAEAWLAEAIRVLWREGSTQEDLGRALDLLAGSDAAGAY